MSRYYEKKTPNKDDNKKGIEKTPTTNKNKNITETNAENEVSRLEELKRQLKEEEKNKASPQKKKKLFK